MSQVTACIYKFFFKFAKKKISYKMSQAVSQADVPDRCISHY